MPIEKQPERNPLLTMTIIENYFNKGAFMF